MLVDWKGKIKNEQLEWLRKHSGPGTGVSQSDIIRAALDEYIKKRKGEK